MLNPEKNIAFLQCCEFWGACAKTGTTHFSFSYYQNVFGDVQQRLRARWKPHLKYAIRLLIAVQQTNIPVLPNQHAVPKIHSLKRIELKNS